jgi:hypothetical protein
VFPEAENLTGSALTEEALDLVAATCPFHYPTTLVIQLERRVLSKDAYTHTCNSFFESLPPLKALRVRGNLSPRTIEAIVEHHGSSLRQLWLSFNRAFGDTENLMLGLQEVREIFEFCPLIEDLTLPIPRSKGDSQEVAIYRTIGAFPKL